MLGDHALRILWSLSLSFRIPCMPSLGWKVSLVRFEIEKYTSTQRWASNISGGDGSSYKPWGLPATFWSAEVSCEESPRPVVLLDVNYPE